MKKSGIIAIIVVVILIAIGGTVFVNLNKEKTSISAKDFNDIMEDKDYVIMETTSQFAQYENYVSESYVAIKDDDYQIEFYELSNEENAIDMYATNKIRFETSKGNSSAVTNFDFKNYSKYTLTTNGKYKVLSRIDNTLIYIDVDKDYKDIVKDLLKEIGY